VPKKEGKNRSAATIAEIWRGPPCKVARFAPSTRHRLSK
jgi:hypothetical protein